MSQKSYQTNQSILYLIPTPIGNMEDITYRAVRILSEVDVIFSEDTRITRNLLQYYDIHQKLIANHQYNEEENKEKLLSYLREGKNVGLVTDRGTPVISDPGYILANTAIENGFSVVALPGATALIPALITSGIESMPFMFYGFLNSKEGKRKSELEELKNVRMTMIFYEAPHRIQKMLHTMLEVLGDRKISISREITKKYEEIYRGTISQVLEELNDPKGEFVIVVEGNKEQKSFDHLTIIEHVNIYLQEGKKLNEACKIVAKERNLSKSEVYNEYHKAE